VEKKRKRNGGFAERTVGVRGTATSESNPTPRNYKKKSLFAGGVWGRQKSGNLWGKVSQGQNRTPARGAPPLETGRTTAKDLIKRGGWPTDRLYHSKRKGQTS